MVPADFIAGDRAVGSPPLSSHLRTLCALPALVSWSRCSHLHPSYLTQGLFYPTCGYHSCWEPSPSEQPSGAPVTSSPWPFPSPTSVCPGFLPSLLCFQPVTLPPTHWENKLCLAAAPLLHFHPDDTPLPFRSFSVPSSSFQHRSTLSSCPKSASLHPAPTGRASVVGPYVLSPTSSACSHQYTNRLANKNPPCSALFLCSFHSELLGRIVCLTFDSP